MRDCEDRSDLLLCGAKEALADELRDMEFAVVRNLIGFSAYGKAD